MLKITTKANHKLSSKILRRNFIIKPLQRNIWLELNTILGTNYGGYTKNQMPFQCVSGPICTKYSRNHFKKNAKNDACLSLCSKVGKFPFFHTNVLSR